MPVKDQLVKAARPALSGAVTSATTLGVAAGVDAARAGGQATVNYLLPAKGDKLGEAAEKAVRVGNINDFTRLSNSVGISSRGLPATFLTDAQTGAPYFEIGEKPVDAESGTLLGTGARENRTSELKASITDNTTGAVVVFNVMPAIGESHSAEYSEFSPLHHPGSILKYAKTSARSWSVRATLMSRNVSEASLNQAVINLIRSWVMPQYGERTGGKNLGAPPPVLTFQAFGSRMIGPVKCVLESYGWDFPNDIDYINTAGGEPFPVLLDITLNLKESWAPAEFSSFDLNAYRRGDLFGSSTSAFYYVSQRRQSNVQRTYAPVTIPVDQTLLDPRDAQARARPSAVNYPALPAVIYPPMELGPEFGGPGSGEQ